MALFGSKKKEVKKDATTPAVVAKKDAVYIALKPRITEKAGVAAETSNIYTFEIAKTATKHNVMQAVKAAYKVTPVKVNIVNLPSERVFVRGKFGTKSGVKKALVFLKKGDKIEIA